MRAGIKSCRCGIAASIRFTWATLKRVIQSETDYVWSVPGEIPASIVILECAVSCGISRRMTTSDIVVTAIGLGLAFANLRLYVAHKEPVQSDDLTAPLIEQMAKTAAIMSWLWFVGGVALAVDQHDACEFYFMCCQLNLWPVGLPMTYAALRVRSLRAFLWSLGSIVLFAAIMLALASIVR